MKKFVNDCKKIVIHFLIHLTSFILNYILFILFMIAFHKSHDAIIIQIINFVCWILSMLFIFFVDKVFIPDLVDEDDSEKLFKFFLIRTISLILESLILFIFVSIMNYSFFSVKFVSLTILFIVNYIYVKKIKL